MRTRMIEERIGENMGPVDWSYDFLPHFDGWSATPEYRKQKCELAKQHLRMLSESDGWEVRTSHSHVFWPCVSVCMYDGWPYWKPTPAVALIGPLGVEWCLFFNIEEIRKHDAG
jgi:hypothetical protein